MSLRLRELQRVANSVVKRERSFDVLQEEITRALGPTVLVSQGLSRLAESANDRLDFLTAAGKSHGRVGTSLLLKFADSDSPSVRKLVARLLPENFLKMFMRDADPEVRHAVAKRLPVDLVQEMSRRFPYDEGLRSLLEAGIPDPEASEEDFDMYGDRTLGSIFDIGDPELSDAWYENTANNLVKFYGGNLEGQWEEVAVKRFVASEASQGVEVDEQKLLDIVYDIMSNRDERALDESSLRSIAARLRTQDTEVMPVLSETSDPVKTLVSSGYTTSEFIRCFEEIFSVKHVNSHNPSRKALREGAEMVRHPRVAKLPGSLTRNVDERAVDTYVTAWNTREQLRGGRNYRLAWSHDPAIAGTINFHLELK